MNRILRNILLFGIATAMFTACGDEPEVTKKDENSNGNSSNGALTKGAFTVAQGKQVYFSQGNLQYQASTNTWRFAENQYDVIGKLNENISETYDGWIDLFGWATSGYNGMHPYMTSTDDRDYLEGELMENPNYYYIYEEGETNIAGTNYDWGVNNKISNGGNHAGMWRTLTDEEWNYLIEKRPHSNNLYSRGCVDGINGMILLPDDWVQPNGSSFTPEGEDNDFKTNDYTTKEWTKMEANGAVFLPAAGYRDGTYVDRVGSIGLYWSTLGYIVNDYHRANHLSFGKIYSDEKRYISDRSNGESVRLVQDVK